MSNDRLWKLPADHEEIAAILPAFRAALGANTVIQGVTIPMNAIGQSGRHQTIERLIVQLPGIGSGQQLLDKGVVKSLTGITDFHPVQRAFVRNTLSIPIDSINQQFLPVSLGGTQQMITWDQVETDNDRLRLRAKVTSQPDGERMKAAMEKAGFPPNRLTVRESATAGWTVSVTTRNTTKSGNQGEAARGEVNEFKQLISALNLPGIVMTVQNNSTATARSGAETSTSITPPTAQAAEAVDYPLSLVNTDISKQLNEFGINPKGLTRAEIERRFNKSYANMEASDGKRDTLEPHEGLILGGQIKQTVRVQAAAEKLKELATCIDVDRIAVIPGKNVAFSFDGDRTGTNNTVYSDLHQTLTSLLGTWRNESKHQLVDSGTHDLVVKNLSGAELAVILTAVGANATQVSAMRSALEKGSQASIAYNEYPNARSDSTPIPTLPSSRPHPAAAHRLTHG